MRLSFSRLCVITDEQTRASQVCDVNKMERL